MGTTSSLDAIQSKKPPTNKAEKDVNSLHNEEKKKSSNPSKTAVKKDSSVYEPKKVYFEKIVYDSTPLSGIPDQPIIQLTVCKTNLAGHWFIRVHVSSHEEEYLNLHYIDIGSVFLTANESKLPILSQTIYAPNKQTFLYALLNKCLEIVQKKSYSRFSYNCQEFVTEIMEAFTDRNTSSICRAIQLPVFQSSSLNFRHKQHVTLLEKGFFDDYKLVGLDDAVERLEENINSMAQQMDDGKESSDILIQFVTSVLTPWNDFDDKNFVQNYFIFLRENKTRINEINRPMLKAWRVANFAILVKDFSQVDMTKMLTPQEAITHYIYDNCTSLEKSLSNWALPKVIFTAIKMVKE